MPKPGNFLGSRSMPKVGKVGGGVPGDATHVRSLEAAGQKVVSEKIAKAKAAPAATDTIVMPTKHPSATTTRTVKGTSIF